MSCDFGAVPFPTSPLQEYWEAQFESRNTTANPSRSAPVTSPEKDNIAPRLIDALEKLAEERKQTEQDEEEPSVPQAPAKKPPTHRRGQSFGQRLLSGGMDLWSTLAGEPGTVQKVSLITSTLEVSRSTNQSTR